ncbi:RNA polymerase sigma factor [Wenyingzhuangia sp. 2_MG-2023]|uniref:RNA polymerase sigma factor n=1 Tax=Wenyingzhuangia sp. 2_MG-2023 TaxID=3062639 RepID=UPI0026E1702D|nr:RNA polymerase sigma factor [Wenyingzhuangia sp. 2_MG-2023]MDO6738247.1 RNA polymerase sigma factor [Wenyingzhuangia sp. 2_MG-2023]MDO6802269.1 RNA polymerase sigma factor [Wenyingzhuangia sp. 1_MG-2023]
MTEEEQLIRDLKDPKKLKKAFDQLVKLYKERLYWHIRKIVINHDDTDDVLQNTFIKVYKNISGFKEESKLFSWMYRIATNEAITFLNQKAKKSNIPIEEYQKELRSSVQDDELFDGDTIQVILQKAIAELPHKQQLVFNMKYFDELKYEEMSEILETSVGALKSSYHHAVKKIEAFIKKY